MARFFRTIAPRLIPVAVLAAGSLAVLPACETNRGSRTSASAADFQLDATNTNVRVGETVTILTRSENTLGRDAKVEWSSTGGELRTDNEEMMARATFEEPGTYTVSARLMINGQIAARDTITFNVAPLY